ncbi:hypothetical protein MYX06_03875 [Patescibacteria group bacterium AH-259-L05]|nr:hypothetical protein [Patescibacteria group bacterium AH-259-L05]
MNISLICPVRDRTKEEDKQIKRDVKRLKRQGHEVREPSEDTDQDDEIGLRIVEDHEINDRLWSKIDRVLWRKAEPDKDRRISRGSWFDYLQGLACIDFKKDKSIEWINKRPDIDRYIEPVRRAAILDPVYIYWQDGLNLSFLTLAYARMLKYFQPEKIIFLSNLAMLELTKRKSYTNVAIATALQLTSKDVTTREDLRNVMKKYGLIK